MVEVLHAPHPELGGLLLVVGGEHFLHIDRAQSADIRASDRPPVGHHVITPSSATRKTLRLVPASHPGRQGIRRCDALYAQYSACRPGEAPMRCSRRRLQGVVSRGEEVRAEARQAVGARDGPETRFHAALMPARPLPRLLTATSARLPLPLPPTPHACMAWSLRQSFGRCCYPLAGFVERRATSREVSEVLDTNTYVV